MSRLVRAVKKSKTRVPTQVSERHFRSASLLGILLMTIAVMLGRYVLTSEHFLINKVEVAGAIKVSEAEVRDLIEEDLSGKHLWLVPRSNAHLIDKRAMVASVENAFSHVAAADVSTSRNHMQVNLIERNPEYLWCNEIVVKNVEESDGEETATSSPSDGLISQEIREECYFADHSGYIYARSPDFSGNAYLKLYGSYEVVDNTGQWSLPIGAVYRPHSDKEFLNKQVQFFSKLEELQIVPAKLNVGVNNDVIMTTSHGWELRYGANDDLDLLATRLYALFESGVFGDMTREEIDNKLEYIEARFDKKMYYKLHEN